MYDDIRKVSYKKMRAQVTSGDAYKGPQGPSKLKQYPLGGRKFSQRFFVEGEGGVFYVYYHDRLHFEGIGKETANRNSSEICRVHPDNSLEFVNFCWMHQQQIIGAMLNANVGRSKKHGGVVLSMYGDVLHPVFKGLRVDIDNEAHAALTPYTVAYRKLIQAVAKEEIAKYDSFRQITPLLVEAMTAEGIYRMYAETQDANSTLIDDGSAYKSYTSIQGTGMPLVLAAIDAGQFVDAVMLLSLHKGQQLGFWRQPHTGDALRIYAHTKPRMLHAVSQLLAGFNDDMLREKARCFTLKDRKEGEALKASKWGYEIRTVQTDAFTGNKVVR